MDKYSPIGFFDSGLGGLSVMKEAIKMMPNENFIYFGDNKNAPYGTKTTDEVKELSFKAFEFFLKEGVKAVTVACNTATGAAISDLREKYKELPIIGVEPAIKLACDHNNGGKILVLATPLAVKQEKFLNLMNRFIDNNDIIALGCPGMMDFVENGNYTKEELFSYFDEFIKPHLVDNIETVVLGCTHYPFLSKELKEYFGDAISIVDGSLVTPRELHRRLEELDLLNDSNINGSITIHCSLHDIKYIERAFKLLEE